MIIGTGVDIVDIKRIEKIIENKPKFAQRVLTANECKRYNELTGRRQAEYLAGRFAAKEAFSKAWKTGIGKLSFQDIEILNDPKGAPFYSQSPHTGATHLSISHTDETAIAFTVLEEKE